MRRFTPAWYLGHNEYVGLLPDDTLGNFCFFNIDDPTEIQWARGERNRLTATYSLILWCDMRTVEDDDSRNREAVKEDLLSLYAPGDCVLLKASHFFGRFDLMADFLRDYNFEK